jgi:hypothetical protein
MRKGLILDFYMLCSTVIFQWFQHHWLLFLWVLIISSPKIPELKNW